MRIMVMAKPIKARIADGWVKLTKAGTIPESATTLVTPPAYWVALAGPPLTERMLEPEAVKFKKPAFFTPM